MHPPCSFVSSLQSIIYSLEILRRQQWNFYRLENEHLTNCEQYRVVNIVPLPMTLSDTEVVAHTAPEAAVLIRQDSKSKALEEPQHVEERKEPDAAQSDEQQAPDGEQAIMRISRRNSPPRASILRHFSLRNDADSSPDSSPESRSRAPRDVLAASPRSAARRPSSSAVLAQSSNAASHPLLAAVDVVQRASAGVPQLESVMQAAAKVREDELAKLRSTPSMIAGMRDTLEKEMSAYGLQGRRGSMQSSTPNSPEVSRNEQQQAGKAGVESPSKAHSPRKPDSPSSSALTSSPEVSSGEEDAQQRSARLSAGVGRRGSGSGGGSGRGSGRTRPLNGRPASPPPVDTGALSASAASVMSVPSWLSAAPLLQAGPSSSPPSAEMRAALEGKEAPLARTPKLSGHNSSDREKKQ